MGEEADPVGDLKLRVGRDTWSVYGCGSGAREEYCEESEGGKVHVCNIVSNLGRGVSQLAENRKGQVVYIRQIWAHFCTPEVGHIVLTELIKISIRWDHNIYKWSSPRVTDQ